MTAQIDAITSTITDDLGRTGYVHLPAERTRALIDARAEDWDRFAAEWDDLVPDGYMADGGTYRHRRYSKVHLDVASGELTLQPHGPYQQSMTVNSLNGGTERHFEPCTQTFWANPVLQSLLIRLGEAFTAANQNKDWTIRLHPYRILASRQETGQPAPEGRHRDGVTFIMTLMIDRRNVTGGESSVHTDEGETLFTVTLTERGEILMGDDRKTLHGVTPIHPAANAATGHRDVLVIAFTDPEDEE